MVTQGSKLVLNVVFITDIGGRFCLVRFIADRCQVRRSFSAPALSSLRRNTELFCNLFCAMYVDKLHLGRSTECNFL